MVCEQHPWLSWPHGDCAGPGAPSSYALALLADVSTALTLAAPACGRAAAVLDSHSDVTWTDLPGVPAGWSLTSGQF